MALFPFTSMGASVMRCRCLFEQSGTWRDQFRALGFEAYDYDIESRFGKTDFIFDLFDEIEKAYQGFNVSVFDSFDKGDLVVAFFPCIRFSKLWIWHLQCTAYQDRDMTPLGKARKFDDGIWETAKYASLVTKLVMVCLRKGLRLVIENPYDKNHFLIRYWPFVPQVIHKDRTMHGDWFVKPTAYWFFGFEPYDNPIFDEPIAHYAQKTIDGLPQIEKSLMSPEYARRFIRMHILPLP